jgi:hypothetical protein
MVADHQGRRRQGGVEGGLSSCPDLIRASINLRNKLFSKKIDHRVEPGDDGCACAEQRD